MPPINVLVMIHGIIPNPEPSDHGKEYHELWQRLTEKETELLSLFLDDPITVEWGHELPGYDSVPSNELQDDHKLTRAQNFINQKIAYSQLFKDPDPNNITMDLFRTGEADFPWFSPIVRNVIATLRERLFIQGLGDVIYYSSAEGEKRIRTAVYGQVLAQLDRYLAQPDVRIHLIAQSLGVTISHDFLYGLFAPNHEPGFYKQGEQEDIDRFKLWREKADRGELKLGSLTSTASQLAILVMRKQKMVARLANQELLEAADIGIVEAQRIKWNLFYDVDDVLGYGTRRLYDAGAAIREIQVDADDNPIRVHNKYWQHPRVVAETAELLLENAKAF